MFLVGDIGGTNARFALARTTARSEIVISDFEKYEADNFDNFHDAVNHFLDHIGHRPDVAVLAVAGPVHDGEVKFSNRKWHLRANEISARTGVAAVELINDFSAMAYAVPRMCSDSFVEIKPGMPVEGSPLLVAGPGTGFGACMMLPQGSDWIVIPGEGGHSSFTPRSDLEKAVYPLLQEDGSAVSIEHICGGGHLEQLVRAVSQVHGVAYTPVHPQEIIERGTRGERLYVDLCEIRSQVMMAGIANMALLGGTQGGIVVAGGVAKHLVDWLVTPESIERFCSAWPESDFLRNIPIKMLTNPIAPLTGAAAHYLSSKDDND